MFVDFYKQTCNIAATSTTADRYNMTPKEALQKAVDLYDNQTTFAAALTEALKARGVDRLISQQNVSYWLRSPSGLPSIYCIDVEELPRINFTLTKHMLRPDVFGEKPYVPIDDATEQLSTLA